MIDLEYIRSFYPSSIAGASRFDRYMLKEYLQLMILDYLSSTSYISKLSFIGGTNLRIIQGIDRFSEDLDFDCKDMDESGFGAMTDGIVKYLRINDIVVETRDKANPRLSAFRRNLYFPQLLFELGLSGHRDERFLIKIEAQDQGVEYIREVAAVNRMGFFFQLLVPPLDVLCAMKLSALLARHKGRDFYDCMFLLSKTAPDYVFLKQRCGVGSLDELKARVAEDLDEVNLQQKKHDFAHLLINESHADRILHFGEFVQGLK